jgi:hypothetical protein
MDVDSLSARWVDDLSLSRAPGVGDHSRLSLLIWPPSFAKAMKKGKKAAAHAEEAHPAKKAMKKGMKAKK